MLAPTSTVVPTTEPDPTPPPAAIDLFLELMEPSEAEVFSELASQDH